MVKATHDPLFHLSEWFTMSNASDSESSVHKFMAKCVIHLLGWAFPDRNNHSVKIKTTEIFKILDNNDFHLQPTDMDVLGKVHRVAWKC